VELDSKLDVAWECHGERGMGDIKENVWEKLNFERKKIDVALRY